LEKFYLSISTYKGMCPGAVHFFGRIQGEFKYIVPKPKVGLNFTREQYDVLRAKPDKDGFKQRFYARKSVMTAAIKWFKTNKKGDVLYLGSTCTAQPQQVLVGPNDVMAFENRLWRKIEKAYERGGWETNSKEMEAICADWREFWERRN
jgi:hypothetical protein